MQPVRCLVRVGSHACWVKGQPLAHRVSRAPAATSPPWVPCGVSFPACPLALVTCPTPWPLQVCQLKWRKSRPSCRCSDFRLSSNAPPVRSCGGAAGLASPDLPWAGLGAPRASPGLGFPVAGCPVVYAGCCCSAQRGGARTGHGGSWPQHPAGRWWEAGVCEMSPPSLSSASPRRAADPHPPLPGPQVVSSPGDGNGHSATSH